MSSYPPQKFLLDTRIDDEYEENETNNDNDNEKLFQEDNEDYFEDYINYLKNTSQNKDIKTSPTSEYIYKYNGLYDNKTITQEKYKEYYIVPYHITCAALGPFIQIFLKKRFNNTFIFFDFIPSDPELYFQTAIFHLNDIFMGYCDDKNLDLHFYKNNYKGHKIYNNKCFLFFDFSEIKIDNILITPFETIWLATYDEIINHQKINDNTIVPNVVDFFKKNLNFLTISDEKNKIYEYPTIVYHATTFDKSKFICIFGLSKSQTEYGDCFIFNDYNSAIKNFNGKNNIKGGLVRFAIFYKKLYIIRDNDGDYDKFNQDWSLKFDCLYKANLYNNIISSTWIFNNYSQQFAISYHEI